eukprot:4503076-Pyramimonas_sp.AAC.1
MFIPVPLIALPTALRQTPTAANTGITTCKLAALMGELFQDIVAQIITAAHGGIAVLTRSVNRASSVALSAPIVSTSCPFAR